MSARLRGRRREADDLVVGLREWAADRFEVVALGVVGSYARGRPRMSSALDVVLVTDRPASFEAWMGSTGPLAPSQLIRHRRRGVLTEWRLRRRSGLHVGLGVVTPSWADADPVDPGTARVISAGLLVVHDPPGLLTRARAAVAGDHLKAGEVDQALTLHEQNLADVERLLGPDHRVAMEMRNALANAYRSATAYRVAGDLDRALPLYEQALADRERVLGPDHPDTLISANNLASARRAAGDLDRSLPLFEKTLAATMRVAGVDHPQSLLVRSNYAIALQQAHHLDRAVALFEQNLSDRQRVLGPDHPDTLASRNNLAGAYCKVGDLDRAGALYEQNLDDRERVLGLDHPHTLAGRHSLAATLLAAGDLDRALALYEQNVAEHRRILGDDDPSTVVARAYLARARREAALSDADDHGPCSAGPGTTLRQRRQQSR